jgi:hypothetical protein
MGSSMQKCKTPTLFCTDVSVWVGGAAGGVVCVGHSRQHGLMMSAMCGMPLAAGFLWVRWTNGYPLGSAIAYWPAWFLPSYYGVLIYLRVASLLAAGK